MKDQNVKDDMVSRRSFKPWRLIIVSFLTIIAVGAILLIMPFSTVKPGCMHPVDALFTAASATCVTGLIVVDTGSFFTPVGKSIILILIQIGGLGFMTMSTFFLVLVGKRPSIRDRMVLLNTIGSAKIKGWKGLLKTVVLTTISLELIGTVILAWRFHTRYGYEPSKAFTYGLFHAVSAFCNAGFALFPENIMSFGSDLWVTLTLAVLIFIGGIGFLVLFNLRQIRFWRKDRTTRGRLRLHSKLALLMSLILLLGMFIPLLVGEWNHALAGMDTGEKFSRSFFQAVTPRTAGFNTIEVDEMTPANLWITMAMMFVGASPCGTGGGIKTVTFVILIASVITLVTQRKETVIFKRTVPPKTVLEALSISVLALLLIFVGSMLMFCIESPAISVNSPGGFFGEILFETVSAFGTVGLSTGITPKLSLAGKLIISIIIFMGRVGPLAIALTIGKVAPPVLAQVKYPEDIVVVG